MTTTTTATSRQINRAPKGGAVSTVNDRFYKGGTFMPMVAVVVEARPATLEGSSRQVLWAARLRREELARLDEEVAARLLFLNSPIRAEARANRRAIRSFLVARHGLMAERSAAAIIARRAMA